MKLAYVALLAVGTVLCTATARADTLRFVYGAPGEQTPFAGALANAKTIGTETFDSVASAPFSTDFGSGGVFKAAYSREAIISGADLFGGAGGTGQYVEALGSLPGYTITLLSGGRIANYFGLWVSSFDAGSSLVFKRSGGTVGSFVLSDLVAGVGLCTGQNAYCGNPNAPYGGQNRAQQYVFVNIFDTNGTFDEIDVADARSDANFESDNHTLGYCPGIAACMTAPTPVPEPVSLTTMLAGLAGVVLARGRRASRPSGSHG